MAEYNFQKELKKSVLKADPKFDKVDILRQIFKAYVAKMFEHVLSKKRKDRLEADAMMVTRKNLISEFRKAELGEIQRSVKWYEELFDTAMREILNEAAHNHQGIDSASINQTLEINKDAYINEGGLFVPEHMKKF
jgi:hypothetical protein